MVDSIIMIITVDGEERTRVIAPFNSGNFGSRAVRVRREFLLMYPTINEARVAMRYERDGETGADRT